MQRVPRWESSVPRWLDVVTLCWLILVGVLYFWQFGPLLETGLDVIGRLFRTS